MNHRIPPSAGGCLICICGFVILAVLKTAAEAKSLETFIVVLLIGFVLIAFIWGVGNGFFSE